jgi:transposase InsO family protein
MGTALRALLLTLPSLFRSSAALRTEVLVLRHQVVVLQRQLAGRRVVLHPGDRLFWVWLARLWRGWRDALLIVQPETVIRWHRQGFRLYWRWKSRPRRRGRPRISREIRELIQTMHEAKPTWGAPRIHGELLKLGLVVSESTVSTYLPRSRKPPSQSWRTFLRNHLRDTVAVDFAVVPTVTFQLLFLFVVLNLERRKVLYLHVTAHPTAEWTGQPIVEAFPWDCPVKYLIRDRDAVYGEAFRRRVAGVGLREVLIAPRSPWQNPYAERFVGSLRRECLDRVIVLTENHLQRVAKIYAGYYNRSRTHLSLVKDAPDGRPIQGPHLGTVVPIPEVGGLHHRYERRAA